MENDAYGKWRIMATTQFCESGWFRLASG
jgi:hypothetical protein